MQALSSGLMLCWTFLAFEEVLFCDEKDADDCVTDS